MHDELRVGSTFSGVGGIDLGLERAGMRVVWQAESDEWCRGVLRHRFPGVPCYADVRDVVRTGPHAPAGRNGRRELERPTDSERSQGPDGHEGADLVDLLCGGFPCQDVSVAGQRAGLAGARSGLFFEFARIADALRPAWLLIENVPGLLSSNDGRDFGVILGTLADLGYGVAWRVLDSRHFGVPQRRRRVFVVGRAGGDYASALRVVCESCAGSPQASACSWQEPPAGARSGPRSDDDGVRYYVEDGENATLKAGGAGGSPPRTDRLPLLVAPVEPSLTLLAPTLKSRAADGGGNYGPESPMIPTLGDAVARSLANHHGRIDGDTENFAVGNARGVRRLTPRECERLQAFPDDWTLVPGIKCPDSRRYGALGNAVTVNVAEWLGRRIVAENAP